jgi:hypothetical protein
MALSQNAPTLGGRQAPIGPPTSLFGNPATFTAAANTQANDYDKIMQQYKDLASSFSTNPLTTTPVTSSPITPQTAPYTQSGDVTKSLNDLSGLSTTGGYDAAGIADLRARGVAPVRSVYSNAQQNIERSKALTGGYSPNYTAATAKMTRDESQSTADATQNVNADIAQKVAGNRLSAAGAYGSASASANATKTAADTHNSDIINQINADNASRATQTGEFNTEASLDAAKTSRFGGLGATQGMASLYGTTPALTNTFGNQVMGAAQLGQNQQNINTNRLRTIAGMG